MAQPSGFEDRLLGKLGKLDPDQVQNYVARLLAQKQFLATIFEHLDEGIIVADAELRMLFLNRKARAIIGWPRESRNYVGEHVGARLEEDHPLRDLIHSLKRNPRPIESYEFIWTSPGPREERTYSLSTLPMKTLIAPNAEREEGDDLLILLIHDVTERYRRQAEQTRARRLASLATLTSGIAHEIKNPLNSLNIHAQILRGAARDARREGRPADIESVERATSVIMEESARLTRIVEDFINAARPGTPRFEQKPLRPLLEAVERIFRPQCERSGIHLEVTVDPELPPLMIDEHQLTQALRNLLRNAVEALGERIEQAHKREERYEPRIEMAARLDGDHVLLSIADNGPGITDDALEHIFEPYYTTKFGGSGLGLMVVYRIVSEHRGALHVDTNPGEGSRFNISLPLHIRPVRLIGHETGLAPIIAQNQESHEEPHSDR